MHLARRLPAISKNCNVRLIKTTPAVGTSAAEEQIVIPKRIQRSPTAILEALSATVGRDPTAPHYKFHDDPYLIPTSNVSKRTFAMAQEAGRKAAKWIKEEHRKLFMHQEAQPPIEAFAPKLVFTEDSEVTQQTLEQLIKQSQIQDAVFVYNLMKTKGVEITSEAKQSLLELLSFYNHEEPMPEEYYEERWFKENTQGQQRQTKTWKDGDLAEQVFNEIEPKTTEAYAAIIRGMAKYYQADRAYALFQEALEKQHYLDTATYNSIINNVNFLKETPDQKWELCKDLLQQMKQQQLKPNLGTLNALLECISTFGNYKMGRTCALQVLSEFKKLGVELSLGSYYYVLIIFCRERGPVSHVIVDILNEIQGKEFKIQHPKDTYFFATAMDVCRNHLHDRSLAKKVDKLLHVGNNYDLIGDTYKESIYYRHYFALLCQTSTIEEFLETYDKLVPNVYIPEPGIMEEVLKMVELNAAYELIPRLWSDMVIFDHINRESLLLRTLKIMLNNKPDVSQKSQQQLPEQFAKVALDIYNKVVESEGRAKKLSFTGQMIGDILTILVRGGNWEKAVEVFNNIDKSQHRIPGTPSDTCLMEYVEAAILNKSPSQALQCLQYAVENHMDGLSLAERIHKGFTLNEVHIAKMKSLVGDSFLKQ
ncbi:small ribosomal subunit protein mS39-like [Musca vetustissima]|uniref:small ribosomal subunit protein mS39-like n=1 Tax=Musca vetustissima TaxID=27455 RepID=UPI002AB68542|nr:small ribosomal subunit protein mS39-like [Musca vetustissima]